MIISRRQLLVYLSLISGAVIESMQVFACTETGEVTREEIDHVLDTANPESHCIERHNHADTSYDDWEGALNWSSQDCGNNEGAGAVIGLAVRNGLSFPDFMRGCTETEDLIPRVEQALKDESARAQALEKLPPGDAERVEKALRDGKPVEEILPLLPVEAVGAAWRRKAMIRFAKRLAGSGRTTAAVAIAMASQWHNCHAFKCLLRHPDNIAKWLVEA